MKITHYLYNAFLIETVDKKIAIDPGGLFFYFFRFSTLIPESEWGNITHILVTHGDPDHYWHLDRVAKASGAPVICNKTMVRRIDGENRMLGPRDRGLAFTLPATKVHLISADERVCLDGMSVTGVKATHGPVRLKIGPLSKTLTPAPDERVGWGALGFNIELDGKSLINLGDTLLCEREWERLSCPDVLMIPIGGRTIKNTMDENEAIRAVKIIRPKLVIPCHYSAPALFSKKYSPADEKYFRDEIKKIGVDCVILGKGASITI